MTIQLQSPTEDTEGYGGKSVQNLWSCSLSTYWYQSLSNHLWRYWHSWIIHTRKKWISYSVVKPWQVWKSHQTHAKVLKTWKSYQIHAPTTTEKTPINMQVCPNVQTWDHINTGKAITSNWCIIPIQGKVTTKLYNTKQ